jgi:ligand-binding SRPBCC domain-containing protein
VSSYRLEQEQFVARPRGEVFDFFSKAENLEELTPDFLHFKILTPGPIAMEPGALIEYRLRLFGLSFRWKTLIESFEPGSAFVDVQLSGPYRSWRHVHRFEAVHGGTLMSDTVVYELPLGPLGRIAHAVFVRRSVERIFRYRRERIEALFGS